MAYRPLQIACGVLFAALSLTAAMSIGVNDAPVLAVAATATDHPSTKSAVAAAPTDEASRVDPTAATVASRPFPEENLTTVLADGPRSGVGGLVPVSISGGDHSSLPLPRPGHRGYEELPPPPANDVAETWPTEAVVRVPVAAPAAPAAASADAAHLPVETLVSELSLLRHDLREFGEAAHGHSAVQAEMQTLRSEIAALAERQRLEAIQSDVERIAERQEDLETQLEERQSPLPVPEPVDAPSEEDEPTQIEIMAEGSSGRWSVHVVEAAPAVAVRRLAQQFGWNLVLSSTVDAPVSLSLNSAEPEEALEALASALDCSVVQDGALRVIVPVEQAAARRMATEQTVAKLLRPAHITAIDVLPLVRPLLTPGLGEAAITSAGEESEEDPRRAQTDALLVVDFPNVLAQVEAMLEEIDQPPRQFVIEAVITTVTWNERTAHGVVAALTRDGTCAAPAKRDRRNRRDRTAQVAQFPGRPNQLLSQLHQLADTNIEATPTLQVLNRQLAEIEVGANVAYRESIAFGRRMRLMEEEIDFLPTRTQLRVRPYLQGCDAVRLQVNPRVTYVHADPLTHLPREEIAELATDVTIPLGCTAVIGGLTRTDSEDRPATSSLQRWFGRRSRGPDNTTLTETATTELVVMLTPRLLCENQSCDPPNLLPDVEGATPADTPRLLPDVEEQYFPDLPPPPAPEVSATADEEPWFTPGPPPEVSTVPTLLERMLGRKVDAPEDDLSGLETPTAELRRPPRIDVPDPELEVPLLTLEPDRGDWATLHVPELTMDAMRPTPVEYQESRVERRGKIDEVVQVRPKKERVEQRSDPQPTLPRVEQVSLESVPPPPEPAPEVESLKGPASFIPPPPQGRPRRRTGERRKRDTPRERQRSCDLCGESTTMAGRRNAGDFIPPQPAR